MGDCPDFDTHDVMNDDELILLVKKYQDGTATAGEKIQVESYFARIYPDLDITQILAPEKVTDTGKRMFSAIQDKINRETPPVVPIVKWWKYAAAASILIIASFGLWRLNDETTTTDTARLSVVSSKPGKVSMVKLSDGTLVWLNAGSRISYPQTFGKTATREVYLEGEAYFEVAKDKEHPFRVHARNLVTRVLGTKFNVKAYKTSKAVEVTLLEGKVMLTLNQVSKGQHRDTVYLMPNEKARYSLQTSPLQLTKGQQPLPDSETMAGSGIAGNAHITGSQLIKMTDNQAVLSASWRQGDIVFRGETLKEVINTLNIRYDVSVHADERQLNTPITLNMANTQVEDVLLEIAKQLRTYNNEKNARGVDEGQLRKVGRNYYLN
ncbi:FecR domain-containing protein [Mucilaginibacter gynuensis]|uniref:FecR domain-containing protein n=1 Tax=Mucilaginibacter gynuensis TaxID=1302236 RepID=A0ABP8FXC5_9SPHI